MKKKGVLILTVLAAAVLIAGCAKKDAANETSAEAAAQTEPAQQTTEAPAADNKAAEETGTQKYDVEIDEDYSNAIGDSDEFLIDYFGKAASQKTDNGIIIAEYSNNDHKATFRVAVTYEETEADDEPDEPGEIPDGVIGGTRDLDEEETEAEEELAYKEVFYAETTAGDLFNMQKDTIAVDDLLKAFNAEKVNKSADGKKLTFMSGGYGFAVTLSDPDTISKDDDAVIVSEEHFGEIK